MGKKGGGSGRGKQPLSKKEKQKEKVDQKNRKKKEKEEEKKKKLAEKLKKKLGSDGDDEEEDEGFANLQPLHPLHLTTKTPFHHLDVKHDRERVRRLADLPKGSLKMVLKALQSEMEWEHQMEKKRHRWTANLRRWKRAQMHYIVPALDWQLAHMISIDLSGTDLAVPSPSNLAIHGGAGKSIKERDQPNDGGDASGILLLAAYIKRRPRVRKLVLRKCNVGPKEIHALAPAMVDRMEFTTIKGHHPIPTKVLHEEELHHTHNISMKDVHVAHALTHLDLSGNRLCGVRYAHGWQQGEYDPSGIVSLSHALQWNKKLTHLDLGENHMGSAAGNHLAEALLTHGLHKHGNLTALDLRGNSLCGVSFDSHVAPYLVETPLSLNCGFNSFCFGLSQGTTITSVNFSGNVLYSPGLFVLASALDENKTITHIDLSDCCVTKGIEGFAPPPGGAFEFDFHDFDLADDLDEAEHAAQKKEKQKQKQLKQFENARVKARAGAAGVADPESGLKAIGDMAAAAPSADTAAGANAVGGDSSISISDSTSGASGALAAEAVPGAVPEAVPEGGDGGALPGATGAGQGAARKVLRAVATTSAMKQQATPAATASAGARKPSARVSVSAKGAKVATGARATVTVQRRKASRLVGEEHVMEQEDQGVLKLCDLLCHPHATLTALHLSQNRLVGPHPYTNYRAMRALDRALACSRSLTLVDLSSNHLGQGGVRTVSRGIRACDTLRRLNLAANELGHTGVVEVGRAVEGHATLTSIDLSTNLVGQKQGIDFEDDLTELTQQLMSCRALQHLALSSNMLHGKGGAIVCSFLKPPSAAAPTLTAAPSVDALGFGSVREMESLSSIGSAASVGSVVPLGPPPSLHHVELANNYLGEPAALQAVADVILLNREILNLDLSGNSFAGSFDFDYRWVPAPYSIDVIFNAMRYNPIWEKMDLRDNNFDEKTVVDFRREFGSRVVLE